MGDIAVDVAKMLVPIIGLVLTAAIGLGAEYLRQRSRSEVVDRAITTVEKITQAAVLEAQQTTVDKLKELNGGKLPPEEAVKIKATVLEAVKRRLALETKEQLGLVIADLEDYLSGLIERYVIEHKAMQNAVGALASPK